MPKAAKAVKQMDQSQQEKRREQNRVAQRNFRERKKKEKEEANRNSQPSPPLEKPSPALDVSILEHPSVRLQIEIRHRKLEKILEQYDEIISQGVEDQSVMQFAMENWPALQVRIESIQSHLVSVHHTTGGNPGAERESAFSQTPRSHNSLFPGAADTVFLDALNRKLQYMLHSDMPLVGDSSAQYDTSQGPIAASVAPFVSSMPITI